MLDSKTLRKETKKVSLSLKKRGSDFDLDSYLKMDQKMRDLISTVEELRSSKNNINKSIASPEISENDKSELISEVGTINKKLKELQHVHFREKDVVRHTLVAKIVKSYNERKQGR